MFCPSCGNQISDNSKFCDHCGTEITQSKPTGTEGTSSSGQTPPSGDTPQVAPKPEPQPSDRPFDPVRWLTAA